ncbi:cytochrome c5530 family protein [endosymbiont of Riftia pachyptila (vent Ph05)]|uniref:Cytochrome c5530 family protein n=1 Tax=endosymbiont of Riftia pachyptila (vent Ph05) TaxID=1048808 RepID=G2DDM4_9GAMM|nr:cytochrome c5530 family protein [endosymbiont of Riftia pachyptila (vent Ph05)]
MGGGGGGGQPIDGDLVVISANDLGMHCADLDYQVFSILPPFNVVHAQVVKKGVEGQPPEILDDTQLELTYVATSSANDPVGAGSINTTSQNGEVYKSNFWEIQDANTLAYGGYGTLYPFDNGLSILSGFEHLPPDLGLPVPDLMELALGNLVVHQQAMPGISDPYNANQPQAFKRFDRDLPFFAALPFGTTIEGVNWFAADGIPLLPIDDQGRSNAYPLMTITAVDKATGEDLRQHRYRGAGGFRGGLRQLPWHHR